MNTNLEALREEIDDIDEELIAILVRRMQVVDQIGRYKMLNALSPLDEKRWKKLLKQRIKDGEAQGFSERFIKQLFKAIHKESLTRQENV